LPGGSGNGLLVRCILPKAENGAMSGLRAYQFGYAL
jgi:hypothetical protein